MAYATRHTVGIRSVDGVDFTVYIKQDGFVGTPTVLTAASADGFTITWNGEGDEIYESIKASDLTMTVTGSSVIMAALSAAIDVAATNEFIVLVYRDNGDEEVFWWGGVLTHETTEIMDKSKWLITLSAVDGLSSLEYIEQTLDEFVTDSGITTQPYIHPSKLVHHILSKIPWVSDVFDPFVIKWVDWWVAVDEPEDHWQNSVYVQLLAKCEYNKRIQEWEMVNYYELLVEVLNTWCSELFLGPGMWTIRNKDYLRYENRNYIILEGDTVSVESAEITTVEITQDGEDRNARLSGGKFMKKQPVKAFRKKITFQNSATDNVDTIYDAYADYDFGYNAIGGAFTDGYVACTPISSDDVAFIEVKLKFSASVLASTVPLAPEVLFKLYLKVTNGGVTKYLSGVVSTEYFTWESAESYIVFRSRVCGGVNSGGFTAFIDEDWIVPMYFTSGISEIDFKIEYYQSQQISGADFAITKCAVNMAAGDSTYILFTPFTSDLEDTVGFFTLGAQSPYGNDLIVDLPEGVWHDYPYIGNNGVLSLSTGAPTTKWYDGLEGSGTTYLLPELVCQSFVAMTQRPLKIYTGEIINSTLHFESIVKMTFNASAEYYACNGATYSARYDKWSGEWWKVRVKETSGILFESTDGFIATGRSVPPASYPYTAGSSSKIDDHFNLTNFQLEYKTQAANVVLASPDGSTGYPDFRALSTADISEWKFGGATDYAEFEADGTLTFKGAATYWVDIDFPIVVRTTGTGIPSIATIRGNLTAPQWAVNDYNVCEAQEMIHPWKEGSPVSWHVHFLTAVLDTSNRYVKWEIEWNYANIDEAWQTNNLTQSAEIEIAANTPILTHIIGKVYDWTPSSLKIGAHVWARLKRITATGTAPSTNPYCSMLQMHVECDTVGSRSQSTKA